MLLKKESHDCMQEASDGHIAYDISQPAVRMWTHSVTSLRDLTLSLPSRPAQKPRSGHGGWPSAACAGPHRKTLSHVSTFLCLAEHAFIHDSVHTPKACTPPH